MICEVCHHESSTVDDDGLCFLCQVHFDLEQPLSLMNIEIKKNSIS